MTDLSAYHRQLEQHRRWNFWCLLTDTASFATIQKILNPTVILAFYLSYFTDSQLLVALIPAVLTTGSMFSQLFWANLVTGLVHKKRAFVIGTVVSRSSMLLFFVGTALAAERGGRLPIWLFFLSLAVYAFANGLITPLWTNFIAKTFPEGRGRFLGMAFFVDGIIGVAGAYGMRYVLKAFPFPSSFIWFFGILAIFGLITILPAVLFREVPYPTQVKTTPIWETFREVPAILQEYPAYARYLSCRILVTFAEMSSYFYTVYAVSKMAATAEHVSMFSILFVFGGLAANIFWGRLGDKVGFMRVFQIAFVVGLINNILTFIVTTPAGFYPVLFLNGVYLQSVTLSVSNLNMATSPEDRTALFAGLANTMTGPFLALTPLLGAAIMKGVGYQGLIGLCAAVYVVDILLAGWAQKATLRRTAVSATPSLASTGD